MTAKGRCIHGRLWSFCDVCTSTMPYTKLFREIPLNGGYILRFYPSDTGWMCGISNAMMDAIEEVYK